MRTAALAVATLALALGAARTTLGQLPAGAKIQGVYQQSQRSKQATQAQQSAGQNTIQPASYYDTAQAVASGEQPSRPQMVVYIPEPMMGAVQPAGHAHAAAHGHPGPHSYGGGTFPYGSPYDRGHPGKLADGGRYGYFGGAHGTPGYPRHHHMHREYVGPQGPPTAAVAYPYYTVRGPRDFFVDNPPSIGR